VADQLEVTQSGRFYHWRAERLPLPIQEISRHSANMHIIPGTPEVMRFLDAVVAGQKISLKGKLVNVSGPDNWGWQSSQTRNDTGDGACELFYVETASLIPRRDTPKLEKAVASPVPQKASRPRQATPEAERTVRMVKTKTFAIPYGSLTVPAGDAVRIAAEKGSRVKTVYRGIEFWVERKELE
jgi:hypothetical protein